jgi:IclR family acetate operon transcriptional repressor
MLRKDEETDRYTFGHKALEIGISAFQRWDFLSIVMPHIEGLRNQLDETVAVVVRFGNSYTYVGRAVSQREYYFTPNLGRYYPLHWAATGKAMLAFISEEDLAEYLRTVPLEPSTPNTVTDPATLLHQLQKIRETGYAISFGERVETAGAIASPIRGRDGHVFAAVTLIAPAARLQTRDCAQIGSEIMAACRRIEDACILTGSNGHTLVRPVQ